MLTPNTFGTQCLGRGWGILYAVRKGLVRATRKPFFSSYICSHASIFMFEVKIFYKKHDKREIQIQINLLYSRTGAYS